MTTKTKINGHGVKIALSIIIAFMVIGGYLLSATIGNHDRCAAAHPDIRTDIAENRRDIKDINKTLGMILKNQTKIMTKMGIHDD